MVKKATREAYGEALAQLVKQNNLNQIKKQNMKYIGAHVSASGGVEFAPINAREMSGQEMP